MRLKALCLIGSLAALAIRCPQEQYRLSRQGRYPLSGAVKQPSPLHKASRPLTSVLPAIIANQAAMPNTANLGRLIARAAGKQCLI
jgi:hypothetical protein